LNIPIEDTRVEELWQIEEDRLILQTYDQELFELDTKNYGHPIQWTYTGRGEKILDVKMINN
jgi:hypothetical protein